MESRQRPLERLAALLTRKRLALWGAGLLFTSWFVYAHTMAVPGLTDRAGRLKGGDYVQFYVMGSFALTGRWDALYDPAAHLSEARRRIDPRITLYAPYPNYPPQVALAFAPLALLPWQRSLAVFLSLMTACYAASVWILWRECPALRRHGPLVAVLAAAAPLYFTPLRYAQTSALVLLIWSVALSAFSRNREFAAGLVIGCLAYKPQFGIVLAVAMLASRHWRVAGGAAISVVVQNLAGALAAGTESMRQYVRMLLRLAANPELVVVYPTEGHSLRGFFRLVAGSHWTVDVATAIAVGAIIVVAVRCWCTAAPLRVRWALLATATVLASPHLLTYDLLLLAVPLVVFAEWAVEHAGDPLRPAISFLLVLVYFAPFSANLARLAPIQLSAVVCAALAWRAYAICVDESGIEGRTPATLAPAL